MTLHEQALEAAAMAMAAADTVDGPSYATLFEAGLSAYLAASGCVLMPLELGDDLIDQALKSACFNQGTELCNCPSSAACCPSALEDIAEFRREYTALIAHVEGRG